MSVGPSHGGEARGVPVAAESSPVAKGGGSRDGVHEGVDPAVHAVSVPILSEPRSPAAIGMIQHHAHAHTFGDYLKATCDSVAKFFHRGGAGEAGAGEGLTGDIEMPALVAKYDYHPATVDLKKLSEEVEVVMGLIAEQDEAADPASEASSIAQRLVQLAGKKSDDGMACFPELNKMKTISDQIVKANHAFLLPGGSSIHPKFYGEEPVLSVDEKSGYESSIPRSVMEFCIINACKTQGKPLLGICRGHQAIAVYHGAQLDRDTLGAHQEAKIRLVDKTVVDKPEAHKSVLPELPDTVYFNHHQMVVGKLGKEMESLVRLEVGADLAVAYKELDDQAELMISLMTDGAEESSPAYAEAKAMVDPETLRGKAEVKQALDFLKSERAVLAMESCCGAPIIGLQFHPEAVQDAHISAAGVERPLDVIGNKRVIESFVGLASVVERKNLLLDQIRGFDSTALKPLVKE